jgi:hypothetical protein
MTHRYALKNYSLIVWLLWAFSTIAMADSLDKTAIKSIALKIAPQTLNDLGLDSSEVKTLQERVTKNLSEWRFPLVLTATESATHNLEVVISKIENSNTPVGFSFSSGNSDPRSLGFQKADVLPVQCRLLSKQHPEQTAELSMSFDEKNKTVKLERLIDHISTVCFDLLDDLHFLAPPPSTATGAETLKMPAWMPSVKVETVTVPQPKVESTHVVPVEEERKQLIIQNQGSPLILKMGHDR